MIQTKKYLALFVCLLLFVSSWGQTQWFEKSKLVETGVYYYPEAWPEVQWERDLSNIKKLGFEFTHFAEFSWAMLEPEEGKYDFAWLDKAVALADKHGLKVVLCTPTPTPPLWLTRKYPEVLLEKENGQKLDHGGRQHYSWSSVKYRELCTKIVSEIAKHYGNDKRIWGWQINNEPSHYGVDDYSEQVRVRFGQWLKKKYSSLDTMNKAWGNSFWSQTIDNWENVFIPNPTTSNNGLNPHGWLDFKRFSAAECADFVKLEADILRRYARKEQFVTTNFNYFFDDIDPWLSDKYLDFLSYTMYPVGGGYSNNWGYGSQYFRVGSADRISFANDFFRYKKGFTGVMEMQPGQVNWGLYNPQPLPGIIRAWLWNAYAGGCKFVCTYRYRQPLYGNEQYHNGIVGPDGVSLSRGGKEYVQFINEVEQLRKQYKPETKPPAEWLARKTAILWNWDNYWNTQSHPLTTQWNPERVLYKYNEAVKSVGAPVDYIDEATDFSTYKVLVAPMFQLVDKALIEKWKRYVNEGGHLILTPRVAQKDKNGHLWEATYGAVIEELTGSKLEGTDMLPENKIANVLSGNKTYQWNNWADIWSTGNDINVIATYSDQFYKGKAAAFNRMIGKGTVSVIGIDSEDGVFEKDIIRKIYETNGLKPLPLPSGLMMEWNDGFFIAINYNSDKNVIVPISSKAKLIIGSKILKPGEVAVWQ